MATFYKVTEKGKKVSPTFRLYVPGRSLLEFLQRHPRGLTRKGIERKTNWRHEIIANSLRSLLKKGYVSRVIR